MRRPNFPVIPTFLTGCALFILIALSGSCIPACAEDQVAASPKAPWGEFEVVEEEEPHWAMQALLWLPNRIADFFDIFRIDVGVGPAVGVNARASRYVQVGGRYVDSSHRVGLFGRKPPYLNETSSEYGISPFYEESSDRTICDGEIGLGADLFIIGGYGGICLDEVADFFGGLFLYDTKKDDWR